jgi:hypothetical protein
MVSETEFLELKQYAIEHEVFSGVVANRAEHKEFKARLLSLFSFIEPRKGKSPIGVMINCLLNDIKDKPTCKQCGDLHSKYDNVAFTDYCSKSCAAKSEQAQVAQRSKDMASISKKIKATNKLRSEEVKVLSNQKRVETTQMRYGVDNPSKVESVKLKKTQTLMQNYGVDNPMHCPELKELAMSKARDTLEATYGVANPILTPNAIENRKKTNNARYGADHPSKNLMVQQKIYETKTLNGTLYNRVPSETIAILKDRDTVESLYRNYNVSHICTKLKISHQHFFRVMRMHGIATNKPISTSLHEAQIREFVEGLVGETTKDRTILDGREIDIYIPSLKIGIEVDGVYWHSSAVVDDNFHLEKTKQCEKSGVRLIHIFENEWIYKKEIVKQKLISILSKPTNRAYARKTEIVQLTNRQVASFYEANHIQGHANAHNGWCYGLVSNNELVAAMSFTERNGQCELNRYASSIHVVGGFAKLLTYFFMNNRDVYDVVSFADRRWSVGSLYYNNGFTLDGITKPSYYYVVGDTLVRKENYRMDRLPKMLKVFDPEKTERENTEMNKVYRIYDCGLLKFRKMNPFN